MNTFEEQLATALVAKMVGMNLAEVDQNTTHRPSGGPAARIDPASFLTSVHQQKKEVQQKQVDEANRLAELLHPLPEPTPIQPLPAPEVHQTVATSEIADTLKSIDNSLKELVLVITNKCREK